MIHKTELTIVLTLLLIINVVGYFTIDLLIATQIFAISLLENFILRSLPAMTTGAILVFWLEAKLRPMRVVKLKRKVVE